MVPSGVPIQTQVRPDSTTHQCWALLSPGDLRTEIQKSQTVSLSFRLCHLRSPVGVSSQLHHLLAVLLNRLTGTLAPGILTRMAPILPTTACVPAAWVSPSICTTRSGAQDLGLAVVLVFYSQ